MFSGRVLRARKESVFCCWPENRFSAENPNPNQEKVLRTPPSYTEGGLRVAGIHRVKLFPARSEVLRASFTRMIRKGLTTTRLLTRDGELPYFTAELVETSNRLARFSYSGKLK